MERRVPCLCSLVLAFVAIPSGARAEQPSSIPGTRSFDLGAIGKGQLSGTRTGLRSQTVSVEEGAEKPEKTKLRLTYQTDEEGPRFEIGTVGSRKGAMKSRLLHVAMDWNF
ncbi:hypothetical protein [Novosphingobium kaempferiae]|uniref:hypothetical protein n=1 Tax=Novosphingobium kaempferiae TaxID=2896849 RepID=UPI001E457625|nr:hypothetical protein [Novosphingobium kaempferiae]